MLVEMAVADDGIVQSPFVPDTVKVTDSPAPMGVVRSPTVEDARVSTSRHGTVGTKEDAEFAEANTFWATLTVVITAAVNKAAAPT
jgi:hypothetical protein